MSAIGLRVACEMVRKGIKKGVSVRTKQRSMYQCLIFLSVLCSMLVVFSSEIAAQNETLLNHQRSRNLNREGYRAYRNKDWDVALQKFARSTQLDPYYTYPLYNAACVLSLRGKPRDSYRIYHLLLETLLQESGGRRSIHQAKMQKDPDLSWFRRNEPKLFILLNNVILNYDSQKVYWDLRRRKTWDIEIAAYRSGDAVPWISTMQNDDQDSYPSIDFIPDSVPYSSVDTMKTKVEESGGAENKPDIGYVVPSDERKNSITVTPDDPAFGEGVRRDKLLKDSKGNTTEPDSPPPPPKNKSSKRNTTKPNSTPPPPKDPFSDDFDPFSGGDSGNNPFDDQYPIPKGFPGFDHDGINGFAPFVPQSLHQEYQKSQLTLNFVSQKLQSQIDTSTTSLLHKNQITFENYRYSWRFEVDGRLFEMQGFFVIRGNVLILETFASSPKELEGLPINWEAFRSLFFIYEPQANEFYAVTSTDQQVKVY